MSWEPDHPYFTHNPEDPDLSLAQPLSESAYEAFSPIEVIPGLIISGRNEHGQATAPEGYSLHVMTVSELSQPEIQAILSRYNLKSWYVCEPPSEHFIY